MIRDFELWEQEWEASSPPAVQIQLGSIDGPAMRALVKLLQDWLRRSPPGPAAA